MTTRRYQCKSIFIQCPQRHIMHQRHSLGWSTFTSDTKPSVYSKWCWGEWSQCCKSLSLMCLWLAIDYNIEYIYVTKCMDTVLLCCLYDDLRYITILHNTPQIYRNHQQYSQSLVVKSGTINLYPRQGRDPCFQTMEDSGKSQYKR